MSIVSRVLYFRPTLTNPEVVQSQMIGKGLKWGWLATTHLAMLPKGQKILILALAHRIRLAAKLDQMMVRTPSFSELENLANWLVKEISPSQNFQGLIEGEKFENLNEKAIIAKVDRIPACVIESLKNSAGVNLRTKTIDFGELERTIRVNQGKFVPPQQS